MHSRRMTSLFAAGALMITAVLSGCAGFTTVYKNKEVQRQLTRYTPVYPEARFAVFNDPHLYDVSLGTDGEAFREYLDNDRKMLVESEELLLEAVKMVQAEGPDFLIVPGDLTKDGEKVSHRLIAAHLTQLEASGIEVFVVPGNHDILNPHAVRFMGAEHEPVEHVTPEEFKKIYAELGYDHAYSTDPSSLSYAAEPVDGLVLLSLDSADYDTNLELETPVTNGKFTQDQIDWIEKVLLDAAREGKAVIAMMHHGIVEHYDSQEKYFGNYIVDE